MTQNKNSGGGTARNPPWSRDETILLLDLYKRTPKATSRYPDVVALSEELNRRARLAGYVPLPNFRNPAGVAMRLRNLARHDPTTDPDEGLRPGGAIDVAVWHEFSGNNRALAREVRRIRAETPAPIAASIIDRAETGLRKLLDRIELASPRAALIELVRTAQASGLDLIFRDSKVKAVEFQDASGLNLYSCIANSGHLLFYLRRPALNRKPDLLDAATARYGQQHANRRGEYRIRVHSAGEAKALIAWLEEVGAWSGFIERRVGSAARRRSSKLPASDFDAVTAEHLLQAARMLADGQDPRPFPLSTSYDVIFDEHRLPPKALFGIAATIALGRKISPFHFSGGLGTPCFRAIEAAGYIIVPKGRAGPQATAFTDDDRQWSEGKKTLVTHLRRERATGLSSAKRARFRAEHGRLLCERCGLDPVEQFGSADGEACIEVHHNKISVAEMDDAHVTTLEDLQCLCANCHRFVHRQLKRDLSSD